MKDILLKAVLWFFGRDDFGFYKEFKKKEFKSSHSNIVEQKEKLEKILVYAWKHVPYYKKILEKSRVVIRGRVDLDKFKHIPILTKKIIRENFNELTSTDPDYKNRQPYINASGGSTGEPLKFIQDKLTKVNANASKWLFYSFINNFPCKHIKIWGSERDLLQGGYGLKGAIANWVNNRTILNSFKMSESDMLNFVETINKKKPAIIEAYAQSIYELSLFVKNKKLEIFSPNGIIASAGTLYPSMHKVIEEVFACPVLNRYGSREVGDMACSCKENNGLHLNIFLHYFEILNNKMESCGPGEYGKVYVTTLTNFSMPLIRYDIGDIASPASLQQCDCGRGLPLIADVQGREMSVLKTRNNKIIPAEFFIHFIGVVYNNGGIKKFQVVQEDFEKIVIKVVLKDENQFIKDRDKIEGAIRLEIGENSQIKWEIVDEISPLNSGKYLYVVSKV